LRLFDDKRPEIRTMMEQAPILLDYLTEASRENFNKVQEHLNQLGINFVINERMVRGLDYYTGTTFEFVHDGLGAQSGIGGGGRYDGLMATLGGQPLSGIGFGLGVDRALLAAIAEGSLPVESFTSELYLIALDEASKSSVLKLAMDLRGKGFSVEMAFGERSLKSSVKSADKSGARYLAVIGSEEIESGMGSIKRMSDGQSISVRINQLSDFLASHA
jgi:histidyl-tRNA synthetase